MLSKLLSKLGRWMRLAPMYLAVRYGDRARLPRRRARAPAPGDGVTLIIPDRGTPDLLAPTLAKAVAALAMIKEPTQLIVVVNGGERAAFADLERKYPSVEWQFHPQPLGFNGAIEAGMARVRHGWTYLLNSDMHLAEDAILQLLPYREPWVFALTSQIFFSDSTRRREETGWSEFRIEGARAVMFERTPEASDFARGALYGGGGSALFQSQHLQRFVASSRGFSPFYYEDTDWGVRAWEDDLECLFVPASRAVHEHRGTIRRFHDAAEIDRIVERNEVLFDLRHGLCGRQGKHALTHLVSLTEDTQREICKLSNVLQVARRRHEASAARADGLDLATAPHRYYAPNVLRQQRPRLLWVSPFAVFPPAHGGGRRIAELAARLSKSFDLILLADERVSHNAQSEAGFRHFTSVHLVQGRADIAGAAPAALEERMRSHANTRLRAELRRLQRVHQPAAVQVEFMESALLVDDRLGATPFVLDLHDVYLDGGSSDAFQRAAMAQYQQLLACSDEDAALLAPLAARIVPNGAPDRMAGYVPSPDQPNLLFAGPFRYQPNVDGLRAFIAQCWPEIRLQLPQATLSVLSGAGAQAVAAAHPEFRAAGVKIIDRFVDPTEWLQAASLTINPQQEIRGSALKVAESLLAGRICVSTVAGARGYDAYAGRALHRVHDVSAMTAPIIELLSNAALRHANEVPSAADRQLLGWDEAASRLRATYAALGIAPPALQSEHRHD